MDTRAAYALDRGNRPHEFALEGALLIDLLDKTRGTERLLVENLITDRARLRKPHGRKLEAQLIDVFRRNQDVLASLVHLERDPLFAKNTNDVTGILRIQIGHERGVSRLSRPEEKRRKAHDDSGRGHADRDLLHRTQALQKLVDLPEDFLEIFHYPFTPSLPLKNSALFRQNRELHLHPHDFAVRIQDLIADLKRQFQRRIGALDRQHCFMNILIPSGNHFLDRPVGLMLVLIHLIERIPKHLGKSLRVIAGGGSLPARSDSEASRRLHAFRAHRA